MLGEFILYNVLVVPHHWTDTWWFFQVYKATDVRTKEGVAIKQLSLEGISEDSLKSIMLEIDLLKNLNHKNIVKYVGSFKTRSHLYIILEYMENGALSKVIRSSEFGAFPESLVAVYISQVTSRFCFLFSQKCGSCHEGSLWRKLCFFKCSLNLMTFPPQIYCVCFRGNSSSHLVIVCMPMLVNFETFILWEHSRFYKQRKL